MKTIRWSGYDWKTNKPDGGAFHADNPHMWYDDACVRVMTNGMLSLDARYNPHTFLMDGKTYTPEIAIGLVCTKQKFFHGKFEICAKLPQGNWLWPAFWLTGAKTWPPEIDVFEGYSDGKGSYRHFQWTKPCAKYAVKTNAWKNVYPKQKQLGPQQHKAFKNPDAYHWFTMEWRPNEIKLLINNHKVRTFDDKTLLKQMNEQGMYVLLNNGCRNNAKDLKPGYQSSSMFVKSFLYVPY